MSDVTLEEIRHFFERQGLGDEFREQEPMFFWSQVAGVQMSRLTQPLRVRQGVLYVEAASHVVAQQLSLMKEAYVSKLNEFLGEKRLIDVRFRVGSLPKREARHVEEGEQLSLLEREKLAQWLDEVDDPRLRKIFERLILAFAKYDRVRKAQGGSRCAICGVHHEGGGQICYYCELEGPSR